MPAFVHGLLPLMLTTALATDTGQPTRLEEAMGNTVVNTTEITAEEAELGQAQRASHRIATRLDAAIDHYQQLARNGGWSVLDDVSGLEAGVVDPRVLQVRARLLAEGFLTAEAQRDALSSQPVAQEHTDEEATPTDPKAVYDSAVVAAVERAQQTYGLLVDGILGPNTAAALNVPVADRVAQLQDARRSWLDLVAAPTPRMLVTNVAGAELVIYDDVAGDTRMETIVGADYDSRQTPIFSDIVERVVFGPYWNVPRSISVEELVPKGPRALRSDGFEVVQGNTTMAPSPRSLRAVRAGRARLRQRPGDNNALGHVKFLFPNPRAIYLHDTPSQAAFDTNKRARSHGCIRVADPETLATWVLRDQDGWSRERVVLQMGAGEREVAELVEPIAVHLVYWLASVDPDGTVRFHDDLYGHGHSLPAAQ